jgi:DUF3047 family protein
MRGVPAALLAASGLALGADASVTAFSTAGAGSALPPPWRLQHVPRARPSEIALVADEGVVVLQARAANAAGAAIHALRVPAEGTTLAWRWKVDRVVESADMERKSGDDFAARVYVFFDVPLETLPFADRVKVHLARLLHGEALPTAAICYVWDNRHAVSTSRWSPYTGRVRMVVLETGGANVGRWSPERRDVAADFRAAFGGHWSGPVPDVTGIAAGNDTDQTGESVTAWFGDLRLERAR